MKRKKTKQRRTDTSSEQSRIMAAAFTVIKPPDHIKLSDGDVPFFESIIAEQANGEWTAHAVEMAAFLARAMGNLEREERLMRHEGMIHKTKNKYPILNQRKAAIQLYATLVLSYRRSLCLNARSQGVMPAQVAKRRNNALEIQELAHDFDDDLIARPGKVN
jgi:hypothetical protein